MNNMTESQKFLQQFITGWQRDWARHFLTKYRKENETIDVPHGVDAYREFNKTLQELRVDVTDIKKTVKNGKTRGRGLWQAIWHGFGVIKSEGDKLFKD